VLTRINLISLACQTNPQMKEIDVCIVGAGPAGTITALFLAKKGISCILADKAKFPRDKICGDGISGWVVSVLAELDKNLLLKINQQPSLLHSYGIRIVAPNQKVLDLPFLDSHALSPDIPPGYTCKRIDFDNFLLEEAKSKPRIELLENTEIISYHKNSDGALLETGQGERIRAKIVVVANGANSSFMKDPGGIAKDKKSTMTGLKAYYRGISGMHKENYVELHFLKGLIPGYFWIFPLPGGLANVGIGLDQHRISKKKLSLKKQMLDAIHHVPYLKERFKHAEQITQIQSYGLPLWDKKRSISGERYMLAGDTASLIDPITGEGIGHAALCGMFAANQAERALKTNDFSAEFMKQYDKEVYDKVGKELKISSKISRFIKHAWLFNTVVNRALSSKILQEKLTLAMTDLEVRKELKDPLLYLKVIFGQ